MISTLPSRRAVLAFFIASSTLFAVHTTHAAEPTRPIRAIVPSAAGAVPDTIMRMLTNQISKDSGQGFLVENKPGAGGIIGMTDLDRSPPDGQTIAYVNNVTLAINRSLFVKLPYDPDKLTPVTLLIKAPNMIVVNSSFPAKDLKELLAYAKANPDKVAYASPGQGTSGHLSGELLAMKSGVTMRHIPYKGSPQAITDLLGGQFDVMIDNLSNVLPYIKSGKLRAIAITSLNRSVLLPDVPTVAESGYPGFEAVAWGGIAMPPGTPAAAAAQLNAAFTKAMGNSEVQKYLRESGSEALPSSAPKDLMNYATTETVKWAAVVKQAGIEPQK